jgi:hypothetical protein
VTVGEAPASPRTKGYADMISSTKALFLASAVFSLAVPALSAPALAQTQADQLAVAYQAARNQLGVLGYCAEKGHVGADVVAIQQKMINLIPAPADKTAGDAAEAQGKKGTISAMGMTQDIEVIAKAQGGSAQAFCTQIGNAIKQAGAALPQ